MDEHGSPESTRAESAVTGRRRSRNAPATRTWIILSLSLWGTFVALLLLFWWGERHREGLLGPMETANRETTPAADSGSRQPDSAAATIQAGPITGERLSTQTAAATLGDADSLQRRGQYQQAMRIYRQLAAQANQPLADSLTFRMGMCAEALGDVDDALAHYQKLAGSARQPAVRDACRIAQARLWLEQGEYDTAVDLLSNLMLAPGSGAADQRTESITAHLLGDAMARQAMPLEHQDLLSDRGLVMPAVPAELGLLEIVSASGNPADVETDAEDDLRVTRRIGDQVQQFIVAGRLPTQPQRSVVERLAELCGRTTEWSPLAAQRSLGRSTTVNVGARSLSTLLDQVLTPAGLSWSEQEGTITIRAADELEESEHRSVWISTAEHALEAAILQFPESRLVASSLLTLGNLSFVRNAVELAGGYYRNAIQENPASPLALSAVFNLAKVHLTAGDAAEALDGFHHVIDAAAGTEAEPAAYLYAGRLLIEFRELRRSIPPLLRARALARTADLRATAAATLCMAYLMQRNAHAASLVLMEHREDFQTASQQAAAAFLSSLTRFRVARQRVDRDREAQDLLVAISHVSTADLFGPAASLVIGQAYEDLGLHELAAETYACPIPNLSPGPLRDQLSLEAGEVRERIGDSAGAVKLYRQIAERNDAGFRTDARRRLGLISLRRGDRDTALTFSRLALQDAADDSARLQALQLMGRIYQDAGDYTSAAMCFSGASPSEDSPVNQQ